MARAWRGHFLFPQEKNITTSPLALDVVRANSSFCLHIFTFVAKKLEDAGFESRRRGGPSSSLPRGADMSRCSAGLIRDTGYRGCGGEDIRHLNPVEHVTSHNPGSGHGVPTGHSSNGGCQDSLGECRDSRSSGSPIGLPDWKTARAGSNRELPGGWWG
eukprot:gene14958-biopygen2129